MEERQIIEEIIAIKALRIQKIWELFGSIIVMEGYSPRHKRLFLVFDQNPKTRTLHVQKDRPEGVKTMSPFIALLKKYLTDQFIKFVPIDEEGHALKVTFTHEGVNFALIFELFPRNRLGLFKESLLLLSYKKEQAPIFRTGSLMPAEKKLDLLKNFERAQEHRKDLLLFHQDALWKSRMADLNREHKKKTTLLKNLENDLDNANITLGLVHDAELIRHNLHLLKRGMKEARLVDYSIDPPEEKTIMLDPRLSPSELIDKIFSKIKRARRGISIVSMRIADVKQKISALEKQQDEIKSAGLSSINFDEIRQKISEDVKAKKIGARRLPYRSFLSSDNIRIFVGKSAGDSDDMTLHYASGNEWWLHVRDRTGAHVVVKNNADSLPHTTLIEAAMLAAHFSKNKLDPRVSVQYTRVKYVRKPKGMVAGSVRVTQEKNFYVEMNEKILENLLQREEKN